MNTVPLAFFVFLFVRGFPHVKQGVFIGVSVEAATVVTRKDANRDFYGGDVSAQELLLGDYPRPKAAEPLYKALEEVSPDGEGQG